jgi:endonuclease/exonuclease/phosphatase family metal-dependent hydrolase
MQLARKRPAVWPAAAVVALCAAMTAVVVVRLQGSDEPTTVTVMTRNLYLGGDITRPIRAAEDRPDSDTLLALGHATHELRGIVDRTDFRVRAGLLADEIAGTRPDLIGLQEVAMWRSGPLELDDIGQPNATVVDYDYLQLLLSALQDRDVGYDVVQVQQQSDVEAPAFTGDPLAGTAESAQDVRLTVSDVILRRTSSPVEISARGGSQYRRRIQLTRAGGSYAFVRGFAWADVTSAAARFRFVTTQLESQSADVALAQAAELVSGAARGSASPTVVVCDCNSDPTEDATRAGDTVARSSAYDLLTGLGFRDEWLDRAAGSGPGFTATLGEHVTDPSSAALGRRLDLVLARETGQVRIRERSAAITGAETTDRDAATGLWPSDHAGVVVQLEFN